MWAFITKRLSKVNSEGYNLDIRKVKSDGSSEMWKGKKMEESGKYVSKGKHVFIVKSNDDV